MKLKKENNPQFPSPLKFTEQNNAAEQKSPKILCWILSPTKICRYKLEIKDSKHLKHNYVGYGLRLLKIYQTMIHIAFTCFNRRCNSLKAAFIPINYDRRKHHPLLWIREGICWGIPVLTNQFTNVLVLILQ